MPPREFSRYTFTNASNDANGKLLLSSRERFTFEQLPDNRSVVVVEGQTLFTIANELFKPLPRAAGLWWIIADFQPQPIHDPTLALVGGTTLIVPSVQTVINRIFSEGERRVEAFG